MSDEEFTRSELYHQAIRKLALGDRRFAKNLAVYNHWTVEQRIWWIDIVEKQAKAGLDTIGAHVVAKAIEIRLTE